VGVLAGYPLMGVNVTMTGYKVRDKESTEMAFKVASSMALREALRREIAALRARFNSRFYSGRLMARSSATSMPDVAKSII